jgi:Raf kinase inhibitor-like YbhB/YbcL family protein
MTMRSAAGALICMVLLFSCAKREDPQPGKRPSSPAAWDTCSIPQNDDVDRPQTGAIQKAGIAVTSSAFEDGGRIPAKHTRVGGNVSPPLAWSAGPKGTESFVVTLYDRDDQFYHWILFDIPAEVTALPEDIPRLPELENGARHAKSDFGEIGYFGPTPPTVMHTYHFAVYALDAKLGHEAGIAKGALLSSMSGHILAEGRLRGMAKY